MFDIDVRDTPEARDELDRKPVWQRLQSSKVAALDLGSNSFHLVIAELARDARFRVIERAKERVQLGESAFETGRISPAVFERGLTALRRLRAIVQQHTPEAVLAVATSAVRDAENGRHFLHSAARVAGFPVSVIDGLEEARLVCLGAREGLVLDGRRMALFDVGGGSTEIVLADQHACVLTASLELGALRLRSMWASQDPPSRPEMLRLERRIATIVEPTIAHVRRLGFDLVVLSCGTARTLLRLALAERADAGATAPLGEAAATLDLGVLARLEARLAALSEARRVMLAGHEPGRVDTLLTGTVALRVMLERLGAREALVTNSGLREGLIADYARKRATTGLARMVWEDP
jgi:exopolyphosphatase / guanosine-5'-triphosphate,3'-diphosphate pyrophosphatase